MKSPISPIIPLQNNTENKRRKVIAFNFWQSFLVILLLSMFAFWFASSESKWLSLDLHEPGKTFLRFLLAKL